MVFLLPNVKFDLELIQKYDTRAPRYTSYPPATQLHELFTADDFMGAIASSNQRKSPLSLYFHIPFCESACYFCGCNTIITKNKNIVKLYLEHLVQEIQNTSTLIDPQRKVLQVHWGGGTPNYLQLPQVELLWKTIARHFQIDPEAEISLEINPSYITRDYIQFLRDIGFNRLSFGIQDFQPEVQAAVNRIQPEQMLYNVMDWIKEAKFQSVNVDLIYGLPYQTLSTFRETLHKTIALDPDRIVVFNFAYVPWLKPIQKMIPQDALPGAPEKLDILKMTIEELTNHKYQFIGMDHFAKNNDELAIAQRNGSLKRNFQGYTTHAETEMLGFGSTSISMLEDAYAQNHKDLKQYYQAVAKGVIPTHKGINLTENDMIRRDVIMSIMSHFQLDKSAIEDKYHLNFEEYFNQELEELKPLVEDGLVSLSSDQIEITDIGRLLVRNIAVIFDTHTRAKATSFSRAI